jgi:hypothetical protein
MPLREQLGVWIKDRWRYERALRSPDRRYLSLANRRERVEAAPVGIGYSCCWAFTSKLHAPTVQATLGLRLLQRCLADAPIERRLEPESRGEPPEVSVLIGHRGRERLPLLLATLETIAAQQHVAFECIVIEQDDSSCLEGLLPTWVQHVQFPAGEGKTGYNRSKAFNDGARFARGRVLLLHDNDMLVPKEYLARILEKATLGYHVINPKRYIFYLSRAHSNQIITNQASFDAEPALAVVQNLEAGGSMAITRDGYWEIGGMDECFEGWGGEDNEFWDRCQELPCWRWGYEPIVHLWHASQPLKLASDNINVSMAHAKIKEDRKGRIANLKTNIHQ